MKTFRFPEAGPVDFGAYLRKLRESRGLRVADVADRSGGNLSASTVSVIERNLIRGVVSLRHLEGFSQAFGIPAIYLFALAYSADRGLDPAAIDKQWEAFATERVGAQAEAQAEVSVPRQQLEQLARLGIERETLRFYSLRNVGLLSYEATRQGHVVECDIVGVDGTRKLAGGSLVLGWWHEREKLLVYRHDVDVTDVVIPAQTEGETYLTLPSVSALKRLGVVVWRGGLTPER